MSLWYDPPFHFSAALSVWVRVFVSDRRPERESRSRWFTIYVRVRDGNEDIIDCGMKTSSRHVMIPNSTTRYSSAERGGRHVFKFCHIGSDVDITATSQHATFLRETIAEVEVGGHES